MESRGKPLSSKLLLFLVAFAIGCGLAASLPHAALAEEALVAGIEPYQCTDAAETSSYETTLSLSSERASSVTIDDVQATLSDEQKEYVPYNLIGYLGASDAQTMLGKVNNLRASKGIGSLQWNNGLTAAAEQRAAEIAFLFEHKRPNGSDIWEISPDLLHGENIFMALIPGGSSVDIAYNAWLNSPGHYANMTKSSYKSMAVGHMVIPVATEYGGVAQMHLWVQLFSFAEGDANPEVHNDGAVQIVVPLATDAAKNVYASPDTITLGVNGSVKHPTVVIEYQQSHSVDPNGYQLMPFGSSGWSNIVGMFSTTNPNVVAYNPDTDRLVGLGGAGSADCSITLISASSVGCRYKVLVSPLTRLAGDSSAETAALIAQETIKNAGSDQSEYAIIARNDDFADAMSATGLAGALKAPILLTSTDGLSSAAKNAIADLNVKKVYIVGGPGAVLPQVESDINAMNVTTERVYGEYSWDTSVQCAEKIHALGGNPKGEAIIAMSTNFQDALSISPLAYNDSIPILLQGNGTTTPQRLTDAELNFVTEKTTGTVWVPGGPVAVPESSVEGAFGENTPYDRDIVRMWGYDGYDTSLEIANTLVEKGRASANCVVIASGAQGPRGVDALAGAALAGGKGGVILLVNANPDIEGVHTEAVDGFLIDGKHGTDFMNACREGTAKGYILGGTFVMPSDYEAEIGKALLNK